MVNYTKKSSRRFSRRRESSDWLKLCDVDAEGYIAIAHFVSSLYLYLKARRLLQVQGASSKANRNEFAKWKNDVEKLMKLIDRLDCCKSVPVLQLFGHTAFRNFGSFTIKMRKTHERTLTSITNTTIDSLFI